MGQQFTQNRKSFRLPFRNKFVFAYRDRVMTGNAVNMSAGGVFVTCLETLPRESLCKVLFLLDDETPPIFTEAVIKRVSAASSDPEDVPGMGFQFIHGDERVQAEIERFCETARKNFEVAATILAGGEPDLDSLNPLLEQMHLPHFTDLGELRLYLERVLKSIELVEEANQRFEAAERDDEEGL